MLNCAKSMGMLARSASPKQLDKIGLSIPSATPLPPLSRLQNPVGKLTIYADKLYATRVDGEPMR